MKSFLLALNILFCISMLPAQSAKAKLKPIFNGKNFKHWNIPENNIWWSIDEGAITVKHGPDLKGSILWTEKHYRDFIVQLDFKFGEGTIDSGIFLRGDGKDAPQIQLGISGSLKRDMTCSPYVPGQGYPVEAEGIKELLKMKDWNTVKVKAVQNKYTVWLNGKEVMNYTLQNAKLTGPIGLQLHANREMSIHFKNISLAKL